MALVDQLALQTNQQSSQSAQNVGAGINKGIELGLQVQQNQMQRERLKMDMENQQLALQGKGVQLLQMLADPLVTKQQKNMVKKAAMGLFPKIGFGVPTEEGLELASSPQMANLFSQFSQLQNEPLNSEARQKFVSQVSQFIAANPDDAPFFIAKMNEFKAPGGDMAGKIAESQLGMVKNLGTQGALNPQAQAQAAQGDLQGAIASGVAQANLNTQQKIANQTIGAQNAIRRTDLQVSKDQFQLAKEVETQLDPFIKAEVAASVRLPEILKKIRSGEIKPDKLISTELDTILNASVTGSPSFQSVEQMRKFDQKTITADLNSLKGYFLSETPVKLSPTQIKNYTAIISALQPALKQARLIEANRIIGNIEGVGQPEYAASVAKLRNTYASQKIPGLEGVDKKPQQAKKRSLETMTIQEARALLANPRTSEEQKKQIKAMGIK